MKILSGRAAILFVFLIVFLCGMIFFSGIYAINAPVWVQYPANQHLYTNGQLKSGTIYDRNNVVLVQTSDGVKKYNPDKTLRTAMMQAVGDSNGNVATGAQVVFAGRLIGWDLLNGVYRAEDADIKQELTLTLDSELCATAYKALNGKKGTVGVYNYKTGEILCMVSSPSFDPASPPDISKNLEKYEGVYLNRLLSVTYTPGSIFKLVTAAAAIDKIPDISQRTFRCNGSEKLADGNVICPTAHGTVNFKQALAVSCNVAFGQISRELGPEILTKYAEKAGLNSNLLINGINTATGKFNMTGATGASLSWAGIGQYTDTVNPLCFMSYVGAIANEGVRVTPCLLQNSTRTGGTRILSTGTAKILTEMMRNNVTSHYGDRNYKGLELCAKSGTAELSEGQKPHSWFTGFMNRPDYPLAFVVVVENGGKGSDVAGAVAAKVLKAAITVTKT